MSEIKIICLDLDGTLMAEDHMTIPPENLAAIREAAEAGVLIVPATGRIVPRVPEQVTAIPQVRYIIAVNGALVIDKNGGAPLYAAPVPYEAAVKVMKISRAHGIPPEIYQGGHMLIDRPGLAWLDATGMEKDHLNWIHTMDPQPENMEAWAEAHPQGFDKLNIPWIETDEERAQIRAELEQIPGLAVTHSMSHNLEINSEAATKGSAIRALCAAVGCGAENVMAVGDGENDIEMLRAAGCPVAMGNGTPAVKAAAKHIVDTNDNAGVAQAIRMALRGEA